MRTTILPYEINEVMNCKVSESENISVGMCATKFVGTDRYAMVVTEVLSPKKIRVAHMDWNDYDTLDESADKHVLTKEQMKKYVVVSENTISPSGSIYTFRKNHKWIEEGDSLWNTGAVHIGYADNYRDPSF